MNWYKWEPYGADIYKKTFSVQDSERKLEDKIDLIEQSLSQIIKNKVALRRIMDGIWVKFKNKIRDIKTKYGSDYENFLVWLVYNISLKILGTAEGSWAKEIIDTIDEPHKTRLLNSINVNDYINKIIYIIERMKVNPKYSSELLYNDPDFVKSSIWS